MGEQVEGEIEVTEPVAAPEDEFPARVESALADLDSRLGESQRLLARQTELAEKLYAENQGLRAGELQSAQLPLVRDLIRLSDDLERMRAVATESADDLALVHESLLDILARNGIRIFGGEPGEPFDTRLHTAAGIELTEDEELDKTVVEVVRHGFRWESGEVIRVAEVRAYRFDGSE
jgi:molecular chaperone GrpE (heat shock protein)